MTKGLYIYKRKNVYQVGVRLPNGKVKWTSTHSSNKAEVLANLEKYAPKEHEEPKTPLLSEFIAIVGERVKTLVKPKTLKLYLDSLKYLQEISGDKRIDKYGAEDIEAYKQYRLTRKKHDLYSINVGLRNIRACFTRAVRWGMIDTNIFRGFEGFKLVTKAPRFLTPTQLKAVLNDIDRPEVKDICIFLVNTGVRLQEARHIIWHNVNLERREFRIAPIQNWSPKSQQSTRTVPLNDVAFNLVSRYAKLRTDKTFWLFQNPTTHRVPAESHISHQFKYAARRQKLGWCKLHHLRHTFASLALQNGMDIKALSQILGHSSVKVTEIYATHSPTSLSDEMRKINLPI